MFFILVYLFLEADKFEYYECNATQIIGINIINFFTIIKTIGNNDSLTLYIEDNKTSELVIRIENEEYSKVTDYKLNLIDIDENIVASPDTNYSTTILMSSNEFQKVCREAHNIADVIELKSSGDQLILSCNGDFASLCTVYTHTDSGISFIHSEDKDTSEIIQGYYSLSHLSLFSKCGNLCQSIKLFLENEKPLMIEYSVGDLGKLSLIIAPQVDD